MGVGVGKRLLYGVDGEQSSVGRRLGMADEEGVDELLDLEIGGRDVLDHGGEVGEVGPLVGNLRVV